METLTEIQNAEAARLERAYQYELRLRALSNARREVAHLTPIVARLREQQTGLNALAQQAQKIDPDLIGHSSYAVRDITLLHVGVAGKTIAGKLDKFGKQLAALEADLPRLEAAVAALEME